MNNDSVLIVVFIVYLIWAIYSGYKFVNGRFRFLEQKKPANKVLKVLAIIIIGFIYGFINMFRLLILGIIKFLHFMANL